MFEIGNTLREARVRRNLTLQQVEEDTKIRVKYVQAMENEDFDVMPGDTYVKGFLRTYATYLGLDPALIIDEYRSRTGGAPVRLEPFGGTSTLGKPHSHRGRNTLAFVAVICLLVLAVIWILGSHGGQPKTPVTKPSALGIQSGSPSPTASPTRSATPAPVLANVLKVAAVNGDCWVQVKRGSAQGTTLYTGTITKGQAKRFKGATLWMRLGSPTMVKLTVAGRPQPPLTGANPADYIVSHGKVKRTT